jgi:hypothetical protein
MAAIAKAVEAACGYSDDQVRLAVAMPQSTTPYLDKDAEDWDDLCMEYGFEFVDSEAKGKNQFGEEVGIKRVEDALKAQDWDGIGVDDGFGFDDDAFGEGLDAEEREMGMELFGLKNAVHGIGEDEEAQVEELEGLMRKMVAIKGIYILHRCLYQVLTFARSKRGHVRSRAQTVRQQSRERPHERSLNPTLTSSPRISGRGSP